MAFFDSHPDKKVDALFEGLFNPRRRQRASENDVTSTSGPSESAPPLLPPLGPGADRPPLANVSLNANPVLPSYPNYLPPTVPYNLPVPYNPAASYPPPTFAPNLECQPGVTILSKLSTSNCSI
ncbi:hypothetical protein CVT26_013684 [Gymnopilus dilepis]|uniref:Uncharacterized protein n=1 Tax=Gymnopilus dilepis TaxID=231916 RepID=A0A409YWN3_9AGAR|nr:hypothetical protein CVT26_013684 [Gymnopilus dilepis]